MALPFPSVLRPSSAAFHLVNTTRSGGQSLTGAEQVVASPAARWRARLTIPIRGREQVLAWRGVLAGLGGRAGTVLVPTCEVSRAPWFRRPGLYGIGKDPVISAVVGSPAARGATRLDVAILRGDALEAGQMLSIRGRLYMIATTTRSGNIDMLTVSPSLREPIGVGAGVELVNPVCEMRLASDDEGELDLHLMRFGTLTVNFIEAF